MVFSQGLLPWISKTILSGRTAHAGAAPAAGAGAAPAARDAEEAETAQDSGGPSLSLSPPTNDDDSHQGQSGDDVAQESLASSARHKDPTISSSPQLSSFPAGIRNTPNKKDDNNTNNNSLDDDFAEDQEPKNNGTNDSKVVLVTTTTSTTAAAAVAASGPAFFPAAPPPGAINDSSVTTINDTSGNNNNNNNMLGENSNSSRRSSNMNTHRSPTLNSQNKQKLTITTTTTTTTTTTNKNQPRPKPKSKRRLNEVERLLHNHNGFPHDLASKKTKKESVVLHKDDNGKNQSDRVSSNNIDDEDNADDDADDGADGAHKVKSSLLLSGDHGKKAKFTGMSQSQKEGLIPTVTATATSTTMRMTVVDPVVEKGSCSTTNSNTTQATVGSADSTTLSPSTPFSSSSLLATKTSSVTTNPDDNIRATQKTHHLSHSRNGNRNGSDHGNDINRNAKQTTTTIKTAVVTSTQHDQSPKNNAIGTTQQRTTVESFATFASEPTLDKLVKAAPPIDIAAAMEDQTKKKKMIDDETSNVAVLATAGSTTERSTGSTAGDDSKYENDRPFTSKIGGSSTTTTSSTMGANYYSGGGVGGTADSNRSSCGGLKDESHLMTKTASAIEEEHNFLDEFCFVVVTPPPAVSNSSKETTGNATTTATPTTATPTAATGSTATPNTVLRTTATPTTGTPTATAAATATSTETPPKRGRGRPRKKPDANTAPTAPATATTPPVQKRGRGRPRQNPDDPKWHTTSTSPSITTNNGNESTILATPATDIVGSTTMAPTNTTTTTDTTTNAMSSNDTISAPKAPATTAPPTTTTAASANDKIAFSEILPTTMSTINNVTITNQDSHGSIISSFLSIASTGTSSSTITGGIDLEDAKRIVRQLGQQNRKKYAERSSSSAISGSSRNPALLAEHNTHRACIDSHRNMLKDPPSISHRDSQPKRRLVISGTLALLRKRHAARGVLSLAANGVNCTLSKKDADGAVGTKSLSILRQRQQNMSNSPCLSILSTKRPAQVSMGEEENDEFVFVAKKSRLDENRRPFTSSNYPARIIAEKGKQIWVRHGDKGAEDLAVLAKNWWSTDKVVLAQWESWQSRPPRAFAASKARPFDGSGDRSLRQSRSSWKESMARGRNNMKRPGKRGRPKRLEKAARLPRGRPPEAEDAYARYLERIEATNRIRQQKEQHQHQPKKKSESGRTSPAGTCSDSDVTNVGRPRTAAFPGGPPKPARVGRLPKEFVPPPETLVMDGNAANAVIDERIALAKKLRKQAAANRKRTLERGSTAVSKHIDDTSVPSFSFNDRVKEVARSEQINHVAASRKKQRRAGSSIIVHSPSAATTMAPHTDGMDSLLRLCNNSLESLEMAHAASILVEADSIQTLVSTTKEGRPHDIIPSTASQQLTDLESIKVFISNEEYTAKRKQIFDWA